MKKLAAFATSLIAFTLISAAVGDSTTETYVCMYGNITSYGRIPAFGLLKAFAKIDDWARVKAVWMTAPMPIVAETHDSPVIFSFFTARLVNTSIVKLDYTDRMNRTHDFFVAGLWNVFNVTFVYRDSTLLWVSKPMIERGPGILAVDPDPLNGTAWSVFTLTIKDFLPVRGKVRFYGIRTVEIPEGDIISDRKIDIRDITAVARSYGSMPGQLGYDFQIDLNLDFRVDIKDIALVAKAYGTAY